jgi:hypothetical protein
MLKTTLLTKALALLLLCVCSLGATAQTVTLGNGAFGVGASATAHTLSPLRIDTVANRWNRNAALYPASMFVGRLDSSNVIDKLALHLSNPSTVFNGTCSLKIYLATTPVTTANFGTAALDWTVATTAATLVYDGDITSIITNGDSWKEFNVTDYTYNGGNLAVFIEYTQTNAQNYVGVCYYDNSVGVPQYATNQVKLLSGVGTPTNLLTASNLRHAQLRIERAFANNVGAAAVTSPASGYGLTATEPIIAAITNNTGAAITNIPVTAVVDGGTPINEVVPSVPAYTTLAYTFAATANISAPGAHTITVTTALVGDGFAGNNTVISNIINSIIVNTYPYTQDFETNDGYFFKGGNTSFAYGSITDTIINAAASGTKAWKTNLSGNYGINETGYVQTPKFNLAGIASPELKMKVWWHLESQWDISNVKYSTDNGATWNLLGTKDSLRWYNTLPSQLNAGALVQEPGWNGDGAVISSSAGYKQVTQSLSALAGQTVIFRIHVYTDGSDNRSGLAFDDFSIQASPFTIAPFALVSPPNNTVVLVQGPPSAKINISWNKTTGAPGLPVVYTFLGDTLGSTNFSTPVLAVPSNNNGLDTVLSLSLQAVDNLLAARGKNVGDTLTFSWSVRATDGTATGFATTPRAISLVRGRLLTAVRFDVDMRGQTVNANGVHIAGGKINNWTPGATMLNNGGAGTIYSTYVTLNARDTVQYKYLNGNSWGTDESVPSACGVSNGVGGFNRQFVVPVVDTVVVPINCYALCGPCPDMSAFALITPPTGTIVNANGPPSTLINIRWRKSNSPTAAPVIYTWLADAPGGNFSNPVLSIPSNNSGVDTALTFTFGAIDNLLASRGLAVGDTLKFIWTVRATDGTHIRLANTANFLQIRRGNLQVQATFKVNMSNEGAVSANGVHIAGEMQGWNPATTMMVNEGNGVYKFTFTLNARDTIEYKYVNGNAWGLDEAVPAGCKLGTTTNRFVAIPVQDAVTFGPVCFARCVDCVVGTKDQSFEAALEMYPNPANTNAVLSYNFERANNLRITLYNAMGEKLNDRTEINATNGKLDLPVGNLSNGVYFVQVSNGTQYAVKQLVIQK